MKKTIESAELKRLGASAAAMWLYNNTNPMDICRNDDGTVTINVAGDARTYTSDEELVRGLDEYARGFFWETVQNETQYAGYTWEGLPAELQISVESFWEPGYDYEDPTFWDSYEDPGYDWIYAVITYDRQAKAKVWYAVMLGEEDDTDWGYGSRSLEEAKKMARGMREDHPDAYIAVISDNGSPICIDEIHDID